MIKCVCLVVEKEGKLLLVQARNRKRYYFPGGKIDEGETYTQALQRELKEELQISVAEQSFNYIGSVVGEAYPQKNEQTELNCFSTTEDINWANIKPAQEITDLKWISKFEQQKIAPAVMTWINKQLEYIHFKPYKEDLIPDIEKITITPADRRFTKTPKENIELAKSDSERHPVLVYNASQQCIGFFTLHEGEGVAPYSWNENAIFFRSFSVDAHYRGRGYGKQIIEGLPGYIRQYFPHINEICLTVNDDNEVAQKLYQRFHYLHAGETLLEGRPVYIMKQQLQ